MRKVIGGRRREIDGQGEDDVETSQLTGGGG
jgi:hypothetical protein